MGQINGRRVVIGGFVAGLIINGGETVLNAVILMPEYARIMQQWSVPNPPYGNALFTVYGFLIGLATIGLYAALRSSLGPGPRTALLVGLHLWLLYAGSFAVFHLAIPIFSAAVPLWTLAWGLVELLLATLVGAWLYRPRETAPPAAAGGPPVTSM